SKYTKRPIARVWSRAWPGGQRRWAIGWSRRWRQAHECVMRNRARGAGGAKTVATRKPQVRGGKPTGGGGGGQMPREKPLRTPPKSRSLASLPPECSLGTRKFVYKFRTPPGARTVRKSKTRALGQRLEDRRPCIKRRRMPSAIAPAFSELGELAR